MLDSETKRRIDSCRDILVGKVPDPKSQVEQITIALIYKFMDDMDAEAEELGGKRSFFAGPYARYGWANLMSPAMGGGDVLLLYSEAIQKMNENPGVPVLFRDIFKNAYLPYRDPETLKAFLKEINGFQYDHSERLGDAFEYLLSVLGSQGDAGQFRTPRHIIDFMVDVVDPQKNETVLDPACGTAGFLISAYKHILRANQRERPGDRLTPDERTRLVKNFHGYDISPDMVRLSLVNLYLHGFPEPNIEEYDTLTSDEKWNELVDVVLANPPFMSPKGGIKPHKRFTVQSNRSEVLFVDYILEHLTPQGRAAIVVPEGIIFQSGTAYKALRKLLVETALVAVVSLPGGVFNPYSGVKTSILLLDKRLARRTDEVLFVKINHDGFGLGAQRREGGPNDLPAATRHLKAYLQGLQDGTLPLQLSGMSNFQLVAKSRIGESGEWNLSGERYREGEVRLSEFPHVPLGEVCSLRGETILPSDFQGQVEYIGLENIESYSGRLVGEILADYSSIKSTKNRFVKGDILYGKLRPNLNKVTLAGFEGICSTDIYVLVADIERVMPEYVTLLMRTPFFNEQVLMGLKGSQLPRVGWNYLASLEIPLPPLDVQREIVAEIEAYQRVIDGARQVVESYQPRIAIDPAWPVLTIGEVCEVNPSKTPLSKWDGATQVSFVPMADLSENDMYFVAKEERLLSEVLKMYTYFQDNDVLLAKVTPCFENGKAGIAENLKNGVGFGSSEFFVLRSNSQQVLPKWVYLAISNDKFRENGKSQMTGTGGLQRVPRAFIETWPVALPDLDTQRVIVAEIEAEQRLVAANRELIKRMEAKVQAAIGRVWGDDKPKSNGRSSTDTGVSAELVQAAG